MQTFLPHADFERSTRTLDLKRLGKEPELYRELFPDVPDDLPYRWPVRSPTVIAAEERRAANAVRRRERQPASAS